MAIAIGAVSAVLAGCAATPSTNPMVSARYAAAVADARVAEEPEIRRDLFAINANNPELVWSGAPGASRVLVVTWTRAALYPRSGPVDLPEGVYVWVTPAPLVARFCRSVGFAGNALVLRLEQALGVGLSVFGYGSGSLTRSQAEGMAQLAERTVTIQLLRDQMYRACEAYANGAISSTTYSLVMSRINDTMVTLLMGENAAGAFGRGLAALGATGSATARAAIGNLEESAEQFQKTADELKEADAEVKAKEEALESAKSDIADPENPTAEEKAEIEQAEQDLERAKAERERIASRHRGSANSFSNALAAVGEITAGGQLTAGRDAGVAAILHQIQNSFIEDEALESLVAACVVELGGQSSAKVGYVEAGPVERYLEGADPTGPEWGSDGGPPVFRACDMDPQCYSNPRLNDAWLGRALARRWIELSKLYQERAEKGQPDAQLASEVERARRHAWAFNKRVRMSALAEYCRTKIFPFLSELQVKKASYENALDLERVHLDHQRVEAERLLNLSKVIEQCNAASDDSMKAACGKLMEELAQPGAHRTPRDVTTGTQAREQPPGADDFEGASDAVPPK